jgi:8-oxo-dGTP pyrophosphatase MutT (NUDIX family)
LQVPALPFVNEKNQLTILLITGRKKKKWLIPKGWPVKKLIFPESAAREALEEASVKGIICTKSLGHFEYGKRMKKEQIMPCRVIVYQLCVTNQSCEWEEKGQRSLFWRSSEKSAEKISDGSFAKLLKKLIRNPSPLLSIRF